MNGMITDDKANEEKFNRLRERKFITADNKVNILVMMGEKGTEEAFYATLPELSEELKRRFVDIAFEGAVAKAQEYPEHMRDLIICYNTTYFISNAVAVMVLDILYGNGTFRPLTENEKVTSNLIMYCDVLPE